MWTVRFCDVRVVCIAAHCRVVCASATVHCERGVRMIGWHAASTHDSLSYLAANCVADISCQTRLFGKVDYQIFIHKISHNV